MQALVQHSVCEQAIMHAVRCNTVPLWLRTVTPYNSSPTSG